MLTAEPTRAEGARYAANLVFLPGLWAGPDAWRAVGSYLGHRGWEGQLLDLRGVPGGLDARAAAVEEFAATLAAPPVLVGHDAGALIALAAAARRPVAATVLIGALAPGDATRRLVRSASAWLALLLGRPVPPPDDATLAAWSAPPAARTGLAPEPASMLRASARAAGGAAASRPMLALAGDRDPLVPLPEARHFAASLGAELQVLGGAGHWPHAEQGWQQVVAIVHRWLVQRLGEPLLEHYAESMEERDAEADDD